ncbi:RHS repeat-associated core domain-containing protein [Methylovulum psychrotolerans]|uniref:RHS repeat-associated core domain-containing protein n=1 Tax=Methylovulum psychrotolerans TaxID=1704499 RepID=UPI0012F9FBD5|nr:RHS repeat-associated core domain-containing protein [Methylovulum psychrotolerans]
MRWQWDNLDPFGANAPNTNPAGVGGFGYNLRFPDQYADNESGLFYNYHRTYDPKAGRYTQSDPIGLDGGMNTYGYVGGNPVNQIDPYGLTAEGAVLGGTIGGGAAIVGSIAIDVTTGGANILATPSEIAFATAAGAAFGDVVSDFVNNVSSALENAYEMAKGGNQNVRDSGLEGYTDQEIQDLYDKAKGKDKKRLEKELKGRKVKNKNKRCP